jgi:hypothetical protein
MQGPSRGVTFNLTKGSDALGLLLRLPEGAKNWDVDAAFWLEEPMGHVLVIIQAKHGQPSGTEIGTGESVFGSCKGMMTIVSEDEEHLKDFDEYMKWISCSTLHHRDPFDRLLIAQSLVEGMSIASNDGGSRRKPGMYGDTAAEQSAALDRHLPKLRIVMATSPLVRDRIAGPLSAMEPPSHALTPFAAGLAPADLERLTGIVNTAVAGNPRYASVATPALAVRLFGGTSENCCRCARPGYRPPVGTEGSDRRDYSAVIT